MDWFKFEKWVLQGYVLSPCLFNLYAEYSMPDAGLNESQAGIKIARRKINNLIYADDTTLMVEKEEKLKSLLIRVKEESDKNWSKSQHSKNWDYDIWSHHFMANRWGKSGNNEILFSWFPKSLQMVTAFIKLKDPWSLEEKIWQP